MISSDVCDQKSKITQNYNKSFKFIYLKNCADTLFKVFVTVYNKFFFNKRKNKIYPVNY